MRRRLYALILGALLVSTVPRAARGQPASISFDASGGFSAPVGELAEVYGAGPTANLSVAFRATHRLSPVFHAGFTALSDDSGYRETWRTHVGLRYRWITPGESRFALTSDLTGGATVVSDPGLLRAPPGATLRVDLFDDAPSLRGTLRAGYRVSPSFRLYAETGSTIMLTLEDDVRQRFTGDVVEGLDTALAVPVTVGLQLRP